MQHFIVFELFKIVKRVWGWVHGGIFLWFLSICRGIWGAQEEPNGDCESKTSFVTFNLVTSFSLIPFHYQSAVPYPLSPALSFFTTSSQVRRGQQHHAAVNLTPAQRAHLTGWGEEMLRKSGKMSHKNHLAQWILPILATVFQQIVQLPFIDWIHLGTLRDEDLRAKDGPYVLAKWLQRRRRWFLCTAGATSGQMQTDFIVTGWQLEYTVCFGMCFPLFDFFSDVLCVSLMA